MGPQPDRAEKRSVVVRPLALGRGRIVRRRPLDKRLNA